MTHQQMIAMDLSRFLNGKIIKVTSVWVESTEAEGHLIRTFFVFDGLQYTHTAQHNGLRFTCNKIVEGYKS